MRSVLVALLFLVTANALTVTWLSAIDGNWGDTSSWLGGVLPSLASDVAIVVPGTYTAKVNVAANAPSLTLGFTGVGVPTLAIQAGITANFGTVSLVSGAITIASGGVLNVTNLSITNSVNITGAGSLWVNGNLTYDGSQVSGGVVTTIASNLYVSGDLTLISGASLIISGGGWANGVISNDGSILIHGPFNFGVKANFAATGSTSSLTFYSNYSHTLPQNGTINVALVNIGWNSTVSFVGSVSLAHPVTTFSGVVHLSGSAKLSLSSETIEANTLEFYGNSSAQIAAGSNIVVSSTVELRENATLWFTAGAKAATSWVKGVIHYENQASVYVAGNVSVWFESITFNAQNDANFYTTIAGNGTVYLLDVHHEQNGGVEFATNTIVNGSFTIYYEAYVDLSGPGTVTSGGFDLYSNGRLALWNSNFHLPSTGIIPDGSSGTIEFTSDVNTEEDHLFYAGKWVSAIVVSVNATLTTQGEVDLHNGLLLLNSSTFAAKHAVSVVSGEVTVNDDSLLVVAGSGTAKGVNVTALYVTVNDEATLEIDSGNWFIGSSYIRFYGNSELYFGYGVNTGTTGVDGGSLYLDDDADIALDNALTTAWINSYLRWNSKDVTTYEGYVTGLGTLYINGTAAFPYGASLTFDTNVYITSAFSASSGVIEFNGAGGATGGGTVSVSSGTRLVINNPLWVLNSTAVTSNSGVIAFNSIIGSTYSFSGGVWDGAYELTGNAILQTTGAAQPDYFTLKNTSKFYVKHTFSVYYDLTVNDSSAIEISKNVTTRNFVLAPKATYFVAATSKTATYLYVSDYATLNGTLRVLPSYNIYGAGNITVLVYYSTNYLIGKFSSYSVADVGATSSLPVTHDFAKMTLFNQGANIYYQSDRVVIRGNGQSTPNGATSITASACLVTLFASLSYFMTRM